MDYRRLVLKVLGIVFIAVTVLFLQDRYFFNKVNAMRALEAEEFLGEGEIVDVYDFGSTTVYTLTYKEWDYWISVEGKYIFTPSILKEPYKLDEVQRLGWNKLIIFGRSSDDSVEITYSDSFYNVSTEVVDVSNGSFHFGVEGEYRLISVLSNGESLYDNSFPKSEIYSSTIITEDGRFLFDYSILDENQVSITLRLQDPMDSYTVNAILFEGSPEYYRDAGFRWEGNRLGYGSLISGRSHSTNSFDNPYKFVVVTEEGEFSYDFSDVEVIVNEDF